MKFRPVGADLLHADGQTDRQLAVAFRSSANAPKNILFICLKHFKSIYWSLKCAWNLNLRHVSLQIVALYRSKLLTNHEF